jgi:hypothetical protein
VADSYGLSKLSSTSAERIVRRSLAALEAELAQAKVRIAELELQVQSPAARSK